MARYALLAAAMVLAGSPAIAGEVTGNGKPITINGLSECAFSGLNDNDGDPRDPGGRVQNYGQLVGIFDLVDPNEWDPNGNPFQRIPGFACNPTRWPLPPSVPR